MAFTTLGTVAPGDVLRANSGTAAYNNVIGNIGTLYETVRRIGLTTRTSDYSTSATTVGAATNIFSAGITFTADGTSTYRVEFASSRILQPAANDSYLTIVLHNGTAGLGSIAFVGSGVSSAVSAPVQRTAFIQFSAGSVTLNARGVVNTGTGVVAGASGGTAALSYFPAYLAVYGPVLT